MSGSVSLGFTTPYTVSLSGIVGVSSIGISNPSATLQLEELSWLTLKSIASPMNGTVVFNRPGTRNASGFVFDGVDDVVLPGPGQYVLNASPTRIEGAFMSAIGSGRAVNEATIRGCGMLGGPWVNNAIMQADTQGGILHLQTRVTQVNNGVIQGINGGTFKLGLYTLDQTGGGRLIANDGTVVLRDTTVIGGTVEAVNNGLVLLEGEEQWFGVQPIGPLRVPRGRTLIIRTPGLLHDGTLNIGAEIDTGGELMFTAGGVYEGSGTTVMYSAAVNASSLPVTHGPNRTLRGYGKIRGPWINDGVIQADVPNREILFDRGVRLVNNNLLGATNSGRLKLDSDSLLEQTGSGRLAADGGVVDILNTTVAGGTIEVRNGGEVNLMGASIAESTIQTSQDARLLVRGWSSWYDVACSGPIDIVSGGLYITSAGLVNDDVIAINPDAVYTDTFLQFTSGGEFGGSGTTVLNATRGVLATARLESVNQPVTHGSARTLRGSGNIIGSWINHGVMKADVPNQALQFSSNTSYVNSKLIEAVNSGIVSINSASVDQLGTGRIVADAAAVRLTDAYILGGTVESINGGSVVIAGTVRYNDVHPIGPLSIPDQCTLSIVSPGFFHDATLHVNPSGGIYDSELLMNAGGTYGGSGSILLNATGGRLDRARIRASGPAITLGENQTVAGTGNLYGRWNIAGILAPRAATDGAPGTGLLRFDAPPILLATSRVRASLAGPNRADCVVVSGALDLHGKLEVNIADNFNPPAGSVYDILVASKIFGEFDTSDLPAKLTVSYLPDRVRILATCAADIDSNGLVNDEDFTMFLFAYDILACSDEPMPALCPSDLNGDKYVDDADFIIFSAAYGEMFCP